jgi:hypothetical protein
MFWKKQRSGEMKKFFFLILVVIMIGVYAGTKSASKISSTERNIESINILQNRLIDRHDLVCNDLDSLFKYTANVTQTGIVKATGTITTLGSTTANVTSLRDASERRHLLVTKKLSVTAVADFDTSIDDAGEQGVCIDSLPAWSRLMDAWIVCTDSAIDTGGIAVVMSVELGTDSGGGQFIAAANVDSDDDVGGMSATTAYDLLPAAARQPVWLSMTPDSNWINIVRGAWDVYLMFNDNASY